MDVCRRQDPLGKEAVRQWMATTYIEPPKFMVANFIAQDDFVTALDDINEGRRREGITVLRCLTLSWQQDYRIKGFRHQNLGLTRRRRSRRFQPAHYPGAGSRWHGLRRDRSSILKVNID